MQYTDTDQTRAMSDAYAPSDRTQAVITAPCPVCGTDGIPGEEFCGECGFLLNSQAGEDSAPPRMLPRLIDTSGREFALQAGENIVGREGADVVLPDKTVSRRHARVVVEAGTVWVEDMGSTNGTRVRGAVLPAGQQTSIEDRAPLQFGTVKLTAIIPDGSLETVRALAAAPAPVADLSLLALPSATPDAGGAARVVRTDGTHLPLTGARTTFGRKLGNTIIIGDDPFVSGVHAEIVAEEDRFLLIDAGSTNGTKLNGKSLLPKVPEPLTDGDEVMLGHTALRFRAPASGDAA